jgi:hypothetical protein
MVALIELKGSSISLSFICEFFRMKKTEMLFIFYLRRKKNISFEKRFNVEFTINNNDLEVKTEKTPATHTGVSPRGM